MTDLSLRAESLADEVDFVILPPWGVHPPQSVDDSSIIECRACSGSFDSQDTKTVCPNCQRVVHKDCMHVIDDNLSVCRECN